MNSISCSRAADIRVISCSGNRIKTFQKDSTIKKNSQASLKIYYKVQIPLLSQLEKKCCWNFLKLTQQRTPNYLDEFSAIMPKGIQQLSLYFHFQR